MMFSTRTRMPSRAALRVFRVGNLLAYIFKSILRAVKNPFEDKRDLVVASTQHHRAHLLNNYPRPPCASSFVKSYTHFLLFQQIFFVLVCIHPGTPRVPPRGQLMPKSSIIHQSQWTQRLFRSMAFRLSGLFLS